jgi:hypothetical protein
MHARSLISMACCALAAAAGPDALAMNLPPLKSCEAVNVVALTVKTTGGYDQEEERAPAIGFEPPHDASDSQPPAGFATVIIKAPVKSRYYPASGTDNRTAAGGIMAVPTPTIVLACTDGGITVSGTLIRRFDFPGQSPSYIVEYEIKIQVLPLRPKYTIRAEWGLLKETWLGFPQPIGLALTDETPNLISIEKVIDVGAFPPGDH